jgi:hypothetical protein
VELSEGEERAGGVAQMVDHLPSKHETLSSKLRTVKQKRRNKEIFESTMSNNFQNNIEPQPQFSKSQKNHQEE